MARHRNGTVEDGAARSLPSYDLSGRVREALVEVLGGDEDLDPARYSVHAILPLEAAAIVYNQQSRQYWRIPWTAHEDDSITIAPRLDWQRVTPEYVPVTNPTQPDMPPPARSLDMSDLSSRIRIALEDIFGTADIWIDDMRAAPFYIETVLPIEQVVIIQETVNDQYWRIPWTVNEDDSVTVADRDAWQRVTREYVPVTNPTQPDTLPQARRALTGSAVRVLSETPDVITVGGYGVRFGGQDLYGTRFEASTDFGPFIRGSVLPVYYDHTMTGPPEHSLGVVVKATPNDDGLWIEAQLNRHANYMDYVLDLINRGVLGWSSGSAAHLVRMAEDNITIRQWPIIEFSLTPTPAEPRTLGVHLVSESQTAQRAPHRSSSSGGTAVEEENITQEGQQQQGAPAQDAPHAPPTRQQQQAPAQPAASAAPAQPPQAAPPASTAAMDSASMRALFTDVVNEQIAPLRSQLDEMRGAPAPRGEGGIITSEPEMTDEERSIRRFNTYVRNGALAVRDLQEDVGIEGGVLVPNTYSGELILTLQEQQSVLRLAGARQITLSGTRQFSVPTMSNSGAAMLTREEGDYTPDAPSLGEVIFSPYKYTKLVKVSDELLADGRFPVVENVIVPDAVQGFADAENTVFLTGGGGSEPQGLLTGGTLGATSTKATIEYDDIVNLVYSLNRFHRQRAVFITNDTTIGALRKIKDSFGNPLWSPSLTADAPDQLMGKMVYTMDGVPGVDASAKVLIFANLDRFWIADFAGMEMKRLDELYSGKGQIGFRWYRRMDSRVVDATAVKYLQMKA